MRYTYILLCACFALFFISCSSKRYQNYRYFNKSTTNKTIIKKLLSQYQQWRGTRYIFGGMSKNGIDCSGFIYITYLERFNLKLPRTTINQMRVGIIVDKNSLSAGDLLFFKTGFNSRHVGIYLKKGQFMHASSSKGVTISNLNNRYWSKHYWFSRHIIEINRQKKR